jgi:hypothetical protein
MDRTAGIALVSTIGAVLVALLGILAVREPLSRRRLTVVVVLVLGAGLLAGWLLWDRTERIDAPPDGAVVARAVTVRGSVAPLSSAPAYLVVADRAVGRYYPQGPAALATGLVGRFDQQVFLGDDAAAGREFELMLLRADAAAAETLDRYLADASSAGSWPGLATLPPGAEVLDVVRVVRHQAGDR